MLKIHKYLDINCPRTAHLYYCLQHTIIIGHLMEHVHI